MTDNLKATATDEKIEEVLNTVDDVIAENQIEEEITTEETNEETIKVDEIEKAEREANDREKSIKYIDKTNLKTLILNLLIGIFLAFISYVPTVSDIAINIKHIGFNIGLGVLSVFYLFLCVDCIMRLILSFKLKIKSLNYATILTTLSTFLVLCASIIMWLSSFSVI